MAAYRRIKRQSGFTLVELLIVVIILAILAAIVIPQFSSATTDAQEAALDSNLGSLRNAIELYKAQHIATGTNSGYPGSAASSTGCTTKGSGGANTNQAFSDHLLMYTDASGNTCTVGDATTYKFGPYLRKGTPTDPITQKGSAVADIVVTSTGAKLAPAAATGGWAYDTKSGEIVMNYFSATIKDSKGNQFSSH